MSKYKCVNRKLKLSNQRFDIIFDAVIENKKKISNFLIVKPKIQKKNKVVGICILPIKNKKYGLMKVYRHQFREYVYQFVTGFVEKKETPETTATRELFEETGLVCQKKNLMSLGYYIPDAGLIEGKIKLFLAKDCVLKKNEKIFEVGIGKILFLNKKKLLNILDKKNFSGSSEATFYRALKYS